jgi:ATP-dependent Clp protease ATP-binding subunit ClpA
VQLTQLSPVLERTLETASFEAAELRHDYREPGHLLIAIMAMPGNIARSVLEDFRLDKRTLRLHVADWYPQHDEQSTSFVDVMSPATFDVLEKLEEHARLRGDHVAVLRLDHLLRAIVETDPLVVARLVGLGISSKDIHRRLDHEIAG